MQEKLCRLCLDPPVTRHDLSQDDGYHMLECLTSIKFTKDDETAPKTVCDKCWLNLKLAYGIQQGFIDANKRFALIECTIEDNPNIKIEEDFEPSILSQHSDEECELGDPTQTDLIIIKGEISDELFDETREEVEEEEINMVQPVKENSDGEADGEQQEDEPDKQLDNLFSCIICGDYLTELSIEDHVKNHFLEEQYCDICDTKLGNLHLYKSHIIGKHNGQFKTWSCTKCNASFQYKSLFVIHQEKAHLKQKAVLTGQKKLIAPKRKSSQPKATTSTGDAAMEDVPVNGQYCCPECGKTFPEEERRRYEVHLKVHKRKKCEICDAMITISNLKKHVLSHTAGPSVCHLCGATCKNHDSLRGHLYYTHSTNEFPCGQCDKVFKKSYSRLLHIRKEHTGEKSHICDTCGKGFFTHYCLNKHIRMTHMKLRPHICEHCDKGFSSKFALRTHVRQHTNDAPYKCELCGEGFRQNVSLRVHKKNKHNIIEEKNCECKICGKMFSSTWAVLSHMRLH